MHIRDADRVVNEKVIEMNERAKAGYDVSQIKALRVPVLFVVGLFAVVALASLL